MYRPAPESGVLRRDIARRRSCLAFLIVGQLRPQHCAKLLNSRGGSDFVEALRRLPRRQLVSCQQLGIERRQVMDRSGQDGVKRAACKYAEAIVDMVHPRAAILLVVSQNTAVLEFDVAGIPTAVIPKNR